MSKKLPPSPPSDGPRPLTDEDRARLAEYHTPEGKERLQKQRKERNRQVLEQRNDPQAAVDAIKTLHRERRESLPSFLLDGHFFAEGPLDEATFAALTTFFCEFFYSASCSQRQTLTSESAGQIGQLRGALAALERSGDDVPPTPEDMEATRRVIQAAVYSLGYREKLPGAPVPNALRTLEVCLFALHRARGDNQTNAAKETERLIRLWDFADPPPWESILQRVRAK